MTLELCPNEDPEHIKYHRRVRRLITLADMLKWPVLLLTVSFVVVFPYTLWVGDWEGLRRSLVLLLFALVGGGLAKLAYNVANAYTKMEGVRIIAEQLSVTSEAERLLREQADEDYS